MTTLTWDKHCEGAKTGYVDVVWNYHVGHDVLWTKEDRLNSCRFQFSTGSFVNCVFLTLLLAFLQKLSHWFWLCCRQGLLKEHFSVFTHRAVGIVVLWTS